MNERTSVLALLSGTVHDYASMARPLLRALDATQQLRVDVLTEQDHMSVGSHEVVVAASDHPLRPEHAARLVDFVKRGGGLVLLHGTLAAWSAGGELAPLAGWAPSGPGPQTELVVRPSTDHAMTARFPAEWKVTDELYLSEGPPDNAAILLRSSWHFTDQVLGYERRVGEGRFVYLGLGHAPSTWEDATFQRLVHRALRHAAGVEAGPQTGVGLIGYGAIGRDHAASIVATGGLRLAGVCDASADRRAQAAKDWSVQTHSRVAGMLDDAEVGLVVVGTPPSAHAEFVLQALDAGKHVVCEKPFAIRVDEVDRMIDAAISAKRVLTVYQSRRWDPDYIALHDVVRSGDIGDVFYMESFIGGFSHPCDFWHSHEPVSGGTIYDWGSHYFDWILQLFRDPVRAVAATAHKRVWLDVTNADQVRVDLTFAGGAQATFLQSDIASAAKPKWYVLGTSGAVVGEWREVEVPADEWARVKVLRPAGSGAHEELLALAKRDDGGFYRNLADHLAWAEPLAVTAEQARRNVAVMEAATHSIARGGARLEVEI